MLNVKQLFTFSKRFATGHSAGSNLVSAPIFVSEISHPELRGTTRYNMVDILVLVVMTGMVVM